jgi:TolB-like protein/AraC-like DNA-binding protein/Tfp pilus assembly protein PilF
MREPVSLDEALLKKVQDAIEINYSDSNFGVEELSLEIGISRAQLYRRLHKLTGKPANQMIREYRLKKAFELLQMQVGNVSEISYNVGFSSPSYFNTCFSEYYGYPPGKVKPFPSDGSLKKFFKSRKSVYVSVAIGFMAIILVVILDRFSFAQENPDKSIAVLPFRNDSPDEEKMFFINGTMEAILNNLCKIEDLKVISRTSVEQYRDNPKTISVMADELDVGYLLEGSGHRDGNKVRLYVQLVDGRKGRHIWSKTYNAEIEQIFSVQNEIAQLVAAEIKAFVTPEEKQLMEKTPTVSLTAFDFYQRGREEAWNHIGNWDPERLVIAEDFLRKALQYDKSYAQAYSGLGQVYLFKWQWYDMTNQDYLDSAHAFLDKALIYDSQLAEAYSLRGALYSMSGENEKAFAAYDNALELNPNEWQAYHGRYMHFMMQDDIVAALKNIHMVAQLNHDIFFPAILRSTAWLFKATGFIDVAENYYRDAFLLDNDSSRHNQRIVAIKESVGDYSSAIEYLMKAYVNDNEDTTVIADIVSNYGFLGEYEEALPWCIEFFKDPESIKGLTLKHSMYRIGLIYWESGYKEIADVFFAKQIESSMAIIESEKFSNYDYNNPYYNLASVYAFKGVNDLAYEYLTRYLSDWENEYLPLYIVTRIKKDPFLDNIRDEPAFQQIVRDAESRYQAGYERVRQWLEENDML